MAASGQYLLANDVSTEPRYIADDPRLLPDTRSELAVPLAVEGAVLGVLDVRVSLARADAPGRRGRRLVRSDDTRQENGRPVECVISGAVAAVGRLERGVKAP